MTKKKQFLRSLMVRGYSIGKRKRGKSEFGAASDLFSLSLRHYS